MSAVLAILGGALFALAHPTASWIQPYVNELWALPGAFLLMAALDRAPTEWQAARVGWLAGASYFGIALHWIVYPPLVDPERDLWVLPLVVIGLPAALGLFWALGFAVARYTGVRGVARAAAFAICIGSVEWLRSVLLGGFPWALPGYVWVDTPLRNLLPYIGTHGLTFFTFLIPALVWTLSTGGRTSLFSVILRVTAATVIPFVIFATGIVAGIEDSTGRSGTEPPVSVRLVQPNIPQREKWDEQYRTRNLQRLVRHSISPSGQMPDLVIWPEVALTAVLDRVEPGETEPNLVQVAATSSGSTALILGALTRAADGSRFNSLEITGPKGQNLARYDKHHLVPFGEFLPAQELLTSLGMTTIARGGAGPWNQNGAHPDQWHPPLHRLDLLRSDLPGRGAPGRTGRHLAAADHQRCLVRSGCRTEAAFYANPRPRRRAGSAAPAGRQYRNHGDHRCGRTGAGVVAPRGRGRAGGHPSSTASRHHGLRPLWRPFVPDHPAAGRILVPGIAVAASRARPVCRIAPGRR